MGSGLGPGDRRAPEVVPGEPGGAADPGPDDPEEGPDARVAELPGAGPTGGADPLTGWHVEVTVETPREARDVDAVADAWQYAFEAQRDLVGASISVDGGGDPWVLTLIVDLEVPNDRGEAGDALHSALLSIRLAGIRSTAVRSASARRVGGEE